MIACSKASLGTLMEFEILRVASAPAWTNRYTLARDTRSLAATSRTVSS